MKSFEKFVSIFTELSSATPGTRGIRDSQQKALEEIRPQITSMRERGVAVPIIASFIKKAMEQAGYEPPTRDMLQAAIASAKIKSRRKKAPVPGKRRRTSKPRLKKQGGAPGMIPEQTACLSPAAQPPREQGLLFG